MADENKKNTAPRKGTAAKSAAQAEKEAGSDASKNVGTGTPVVATTPESKEAKGAERAGKEDSEVVVNKEDLKALMARMDELEKDNKRLLSVADRGRMFALEEKERATKKNVSTVKLSRLDRGGKLVVAWKTKENESYVDGNRTVIRQSIELFFQDGKSEVMPHITFYRRQNKDTVVPILGRNKDEETGTVILKVQLDDGTTLEIDKKFVN